MLCCRNTTFQVGKQECCPLNSPLTSLSPMTMHAYNTDLLLKWRVLRYSGSWQLCCCCSVVWLFVTPWSAARQTALSLTICKVCSNSHPLSQLCYLSISSSVTPFSSHPQSFPTSGSFPMSQLFTSGDQRIGASILVLPMNGQGWFPLGLTSFISLLFKGLSRVFSSTTVQKYKFFDTQPSLWSNSHICIWLLEKP